MRLSDKLLLSTLSVDNSLFHLASASFTTLSKFQSGISALMLSSAFSGLTGEIPTFSITVDGALSKLIKPFTMSAVSSVPSANLVSLYTLKSLSGTDDLIAKNIQRFFAQPFDLRRPTIV